jgi:2-dehydro-3-deoxygluconokinase
MSKVICFGELMLRLAPEGYMRIVQADSFCATYGGAEANVAVSLANFGVDVSFISKLPFNAIGDAAINSLRRYGVDTKSIVRGGDRVGIYYLEKGASQRGSLVVYDRAHSSIQEASAADFDWAQIFNDTCWFHFSGITPALGDTVAAICLEACKAAKARGIGVSCDLNYRKKLWSRTKANEVMTQLMPYVDLCIANEEDAADVFGIHAEATNITSGELNKEGYISVARQLQERFSLKQVAITLRSSLSASDNNWSALLYENGKAIFSRDYSIHIVDRVGGGDSFSAGLIYSHLAGFSAENSIEFAVAASCLKHSIEGDFNHVSVDEVLKLAHGDASGRVSR